MSNVLRVAIVDPDDDSRETLKSMLLGMDMIWLEAECSRYEFFADVVDQTDPDLAVVALDEDKDKGLNLISRLRESAPNCSVVAVSSSTDGELILGAMRSGAKEYITLPVKAEELVSALQRLASQRTASEGGKARSSRVIAIAGSSGGVGSTSLAVSLGCALAANEENSVALIDLDMALGDADVFLDTIPDYTLADVAQNVSRIDFSLLKRSLTKHSSGLHLLPRPVLLHESAFIRADDIQRIIGLLKASFSHVIFDISKSYSAVDIMAMQEAQNVLLVTQLDLPCLRNVVRLMMSFAEIDDLREKTRIVVNRVGLDSGQISLKKAQETIGGDIFWRIPNDYRVMSEVRNNGVPLLERAPKAAITQSILELAVAIDGGLSVPQTGDKAGISRFLGFLNKGGSVKSESGSTG
jgi:pilus assembly protein CpaE